jgi:hypothetical protein
MQASGEALDGIDKGIAIGMKWSPTALKSSDEFVEAAAKKERWIEPQRAGPQESGLIEQKLPRRKENRDIEPGNAGGPECRGPDSTQPSWK